MKRLGDARPVVLGPLVALLVAAAFAQVACEQDPAGAVKVAQPAASSAPAAATDAADAGPAKSPLIWRPALCPPPAEPVGGSSSLIGSGACAFEQHAAAKCSTTDDDVLMEGLRDMPDGALFMVYFSVENFNKSGAFDNAQLVVGVQDSGGLYRWATDHAHVVLAADQNSVKISETHLPSVPPLQEKEVVVSGTFACGPKVESHNGRGR